MKFGEGESKYIKGSDLQGREVTVQIDTLRTEEVGQDRDAETKWVLYFIGKKKGMVLNVTNQRILIDLYGEPTGEGDEAVAAQYHGKGVVLYHDPNISYAGKRTGGLRLKAPAAMTPPPPPADDAPPPQEPGGPTSLPGQAMGGAGADDIPFAPSRI